MPEDSLDLFREDGLFMVSQYLFGHDIQMAIVLLKLVENSKVYINKDVHT